jgi:predicted RNA-binding protein with PIN domain
MTTAHTVTLFSKEGGEISCAVQRPTLDRNRNFQKLAVAASHFRNQRNALWQGAQQVNAELALAEVAAENAHAEQAESAKGRLADAQGAFDALSKKIETLDDKIQANTVEQVKLVIVDTSDIAWDNIPKEGAEDAISFFLSGKPASATT